jgi:hypothetical protein
VLERAALTMACQIQRTSTVDQGGRRVRPCLRAGQGNRRSHR